MIGLNSNKKIKDINNNSKRTFNNNKLEIKLAEEISGKKITESKFSNINESNNKRNISQNKLKNEKITDIKKPSIRNNSVANINLKNIKPDKLYQNPEMKGIIDLKKDLGINNQNNIINKIDLILNHIKSPNLNIDGLDTKSVHKPKMIEKNKKDSHTKLSVNSNFTNKPSDKFNKKAGDPFSVSKKQKSNFVYVYSAGGIPCRIVHGSIRLKLRWDIPPEKLEYDPILLVCFEGLMENEHPYNFASRECVRQMLLADDSFEKVLPLLTKIIPSLRQALSGNEKDAFIDSLEITMILSDLVKELINPHLHLILQPINKKIFDLKYKEKIYEVLRAFEINGGEEAFKEIKKKIPTYVCSL